MLRPAVPPHLDAPGRFGTLCPGFACRRFAAASLVASFPSCAVAELPMASPSRCAASQGRRYASRCVAFAPRVSPMQCRGQSSQCCAFAPRCQSSQCRRWANRRNAAAALCFALALPCCDERPVQCRRIAPRSSALATSRLALPQRFCSMQCRCGAYLRPCASTPTMPCRCGAKQCQQCHRNSMLCNAVASPVMSTHCRRMSRPCHSWLCRRSSLLFTAPAFPRFAAATPSKAPAPSACCRTRPRPSWRRSRGR